VKDTELIAVIQAHRRESLGFQDGELSNERAASMDHYHGRPYGNEQEGRSQVVSKDLSEAVDWIMPAIMRVFVQSGNIAEFDPIGPEDEELAQQESDVTNKVFMEDNNGFMVLHDAVKDALLLKNGYIKHLWEETEDTETTQYSGLSVDELGMLFSGLEADGAKVEVLGQEARQEIIESPQGQMPIEVFDVRIRATRKVGKVVCVPVPPEELRVSKKARGALSESPFVEHVTTKTRSELIELGMKRSFVDELPAYNDYKRTNEVLARDSVLDESDENGPAIIDRSMDLIEYCEAYLRVDYDGDGISELRKVVTVANKIPPGEEWNEEIDQVPVTGGTPKRIPHRHIGESLDDDISDLQEIKTVLIRQMLDNIYATNNSQWVVNERVVVSDFLESLPGGIKRVKGMEPVSGSVEPVIATPIMGQIMPALDYIDSTKEARTGINKATTGLDPDILAQSTKGAFMENLNRASQKTEMITRMLAETLVKPALLAVHALLIKHQDKPMVTRLRGKFVAVNPQEWRRRTDMRLRVGIGTGNEEEKRQKIMLIAQAQDKLAGVGLVAPRHAYALFTDLCASMGMEMPEKYAMSPDSEEFRNKPPTQNPLLQIEQMKLQANERDAQLKAQIEQQKANANLVQEQARSTNDVAIEREKIAAQMQLERYKAELKAETDRLIAEMQIANEQRKSDIALSQEMAATEGAILSGETGAAMRETIDQIMAQVGQLMQGIQDQSSRHEASRVVSVRKIKGPDGRLIGAVQVRADGTETPIQIQ
jgi:hypothetical protein